MPGLIPELIQPDIGFLGGVAPDLADILPSGDWEPYLPTFETQNKLGLETMACVSYSRLNCSETQANFYGKPLNLSDRALAWISGTTKQGNTYYNVDQAFRRSGTCPEPIWPWNVPMTWNEYYTAPPSDVQEEMKRLLDEWDVGMRVYVPMNVESLKEALKKGPLWACTHDHSFEIYRVDDKIHIYDTYILEGDGKRHWPLSDITKLVSAYIVPFTPKANAPQPMIVLPPDCLVVIVNGRGGLYMNADGSKLYDDDAGKLKLVSDARNSVSCPESTCTHCEPGKYTPHNKTTSTPVVHLQEEDIAGIPRVNLKGQPV